MDEKLNEPVEGLTTEKNIPSLGDTINFKMLFRIKGSPGLFFANSMRNKSGMIGMYSVKDEKNITVHINSVECLANYIFQKMDGTEIKIPEVFNNLNTIPNGELEKIPIEILQETMVPGYDPHYFKPAHAERIRVWFLELENRVKKYISEE